MERAREVSFPAGARIFEEGRHAGRFRMIRTGSVALDPHVPGRSAAVVETLSPGDLLGWSRLFPPCARHLGAEALSPVRAVEFDAARVREPCEADPVPGRAVPWRRPGSSRTGCGAPAPGCWTRTGRTAAVRGGRSAGGEASGRPRPSSGGHR